MPNPTPIASYHGKVLHILFETSTDLTPFLPSGLTPVDPHRAFIKAERLKIRSHDADRNPAAYTHYQQICVTTLATAPGFGARHRNFLMWEDRHWAIGSSMAAAKRYGSIEMTQVYETERALAEDGAPIPFSVDVQTDGFVLMRFAGMLDGRQRVSAPPYGGFYVGGEPGVHLQALTLAYSELSRPLYGTGELSFGHAPHEQRNLPGSGEPWPATLLKDIRVEGCVLQDLTFDRMSGGEFALVRKAGEEMFAA